MAYEAETPRLYLQRLSIDEHLEDIWEQFQEPRSVMWTRCTWGDSTYTYQQRARGQAPKRTIEEARDLMVYLLPSEQNPNIDKFALIIKPDPVNPQPWFNAKGKPKCIGMVGTNRESAYGLETGYCIHPAYWGHGYASEGFAAFLKLFWTLEEREGFRFLVGKADPGNIASTRVLQKMGAWEGEVLKKVWKRTGEDGQVQERDLALWFLDRPVTVRAKDKEEKETVPIQRTSNI